MELKTRVWGAGKLVLLAGALVATYLLFAAASMRIALRTGEIFLLSPHVPDAYDGRYFGATRASEVIGSGTLLWPR